MWNVSLARHVPEPTAAVQAAPHITAQWGAPATPSSAALAMRARSDTAWHQRLAQGVPVAAWFRPCTAGSCEGLATLSGAKTGSGFKRASVKVANEATTTIAGPAMTSHTIGTRHHFTERESKGDAVWLTVLLTVWLPY